jgi:hypothetical protein
LEFQAVGRCESRGRICHRSRSDWPLNVGTSRLVCANSGHSFTRDRQLTFFGLFAVSSMLVCYALKAVVIGCCSPLRALSDQLGALFKGVRPFGLVKRFGRLSHFRLGSLHSHPLQLCGHRPERLQGA